MSPERRARLATTILVILCGMLALGVLWDSLLGVAVKSAEH